jgi:transitional endoplasmic reticulum ATPase
MSQKIKFDSEEAALRHPGVTSIVRNRREALCSVTLVHGAVNDPINPELNLDRALLKTVKGLQVKYNLAEGFRFIDENHEKAFKELAKNFLVSNNALNDLLGNANLGNLPGNLGTQNGEVNLPTEPVEALALLDRILKKKSSDLGNFSGMPQKSISLQVIIEHAESLWPRQPGASAAERALLVRILKWAANEDIISNGHYAVLLTTSRARINQQLLETSSSRIKQVHLQLPDIDQRREQIEYILNDSGIPAKLADDLTVDDLAKLTAGLTRMQIEDLFQGAIAAGRCLTREDAKDAKDEIICEEFDSVLSVKTPEVGFDGLGGLDYLIDFLKKKVVAPLRDGDKKVAKSGILLPGPPGTAKTALAEAFAKEAGLPFIFFNLSRIFGSLLGETESRMEKALNAFRSLAPCIIFVDEIDTKAQRGGTRSDGGVGQRVLSALLEFMSDPEIRGKVMLMSATNRPGSLDPAMIRSRRFDCVIPMMPPHRTDNQARVSIIKAIALRWGIELNTPEDSLMAIAQNTAGRTGANLEEMLMLALDNARDAGRGDVIEAEDLNYALSVQIVPHNSGAEEMAWEAMNACNNIELLPPGWKEEMLEKLRPSQKQDADSGMDDLGGIAAEGGRRVSSRS